MKPSSPLVSVLLPVKNNLNFLPMAIKSVLGQTHSNLELIICSSAQEPLISPLIAEFLSDHRNRIKYIDCVGKNLAQSLNLGLEHSRGEFVARVDADDLMHPDRLAKQLELFRANPELVVCGSYMQEIDDLSNPTGYIFYYYRSNFFLKALLPKKIPFAHPSVMLRTNILKSVGGYNEEKPFGEDYDLWIRLAKKGIFANVPLALTSYRVHESQVSVVNRDATIKSISDSIKYYGFSLKKGQQIIYFFVSFFDFLGALFFPPRRIK